MHGSIKISQLDIAVLSIYFITLLATGIFSLFSSKRGTVTGYFLAGRFMTWLPIGASIFASNIGSEHFIGLAGSGAASGIAVGAFELNASLLLQLLGWVFLPVYIASGVCTLPEYMQKRFGGYRIQIYLSGLSLLLYIFTKISVNLYSGSLFLTEALNWNTWISIIMLLGLTAVITVTGGLAAVLYTDTLQFFVMIIGALILSIMSFVKVGGFEGLLDSYGRSIAPINAFSRDGSELLVSLANVSNRANMSTLSELADFSGVPSSLRCSLPSTKSFKLLREINDPDMPWLGFLLGQTPASIWYWCTDQMMVQRVLAAKSLSHAQGATLMAGFIKLLPMFVIVIPGMISRVLFPDVIGCLPGSECYKVCGQSSGCTNMAYPKLVVGIMPSGLRGLMLAVMLAALISDLTSIFNSASTLFTVDIYQRIRKKAKNMELMIVGRLFVVVMVILSIAWIPVIQQFQGSQLYIYIQAVSAYLSPPIASVYICAVLFRRCNEFGAFSGLMYGLLIGLIRMILGIVYPDPICGELDNRPWIVGKVHYMYFALFSFATTGIMVLLVSLLKKPPTFSQLHRLTFWTAWDPSIPEQQVYSASKSCSQYSEPENLELPTVNSLEPENAEDINHLKHNGGKKDSVVTEAPRIRDVPETSFLNEPGDHYTIESHKHIPAKMSFKNILLWICGCSDHPCPDLQGCECEPYRDKCECCFGNRKSSTVITPKPKNELSQEQRIQKITSLYQNRRTRICLNIGLIIIISLTVFCFIFFSLYFGPNSVGPLPVFFGNFTNSNLTESEIRDAVKTLKDLGLVLTEN